MTDVTVLVGDCLASLLALPDQSVHTCVTSPPYFGLRSYDEASLRIDPSLPEEKRAWLDAELLQRCVHERMGAVYHSDDIPEDLRSYFVRAEIGLEDTPDAFVARLVEVFREVRRVLRDDATLWLNLGDSWAGAKSKAVQVSLSDYGCNGAASYAEAAARRSSRPAAPPRRWAATTALPSRPASRSPAFASLPTFFPASMPVLRP